MNSKTQLIKLLCFGGSCLLSIGGLALSIISEMNDQKILEQLVSSEVAKAMIKLKK